MRINEESNASAGIALITIIANVVAAQQVLITVAPGPPIGVREPTQHLLSWLMWGMAEQSWQ